MSKRTEQVASLLVQEINEILLRDFEAPLGTLISVSTVTVSPDLKNATAYLSILPHNKLGSALTAVTKFLGHLQRQLNKNMIMRSVPKIKWAIDDRDIKYEAIDEALKQ